VILNDCEILVIEYHSRDSI